MQFTNVAQFPCIHRRLGSNQFVDEKWNFSLLLFSLISTITCLSFLCEVKLVGDTSVLFGDYIRFKDIKSHIRLLSLTDTRVSLQSRYTFFFHLNALIRN